MRRCCSGRACRRAVCARVTDQRGFTVVEVLTVVVVLAIVSVAVLAIFSGLGGLFHSQETRIQNQDDARTAMNQVARFIRMATSSADNMTSQSNAVLTASEQDIEFYCDLDGDDTADKVRYYLDGSTLKMQSVAPVELEDEPYYEYPEYDTDGIVVQEAIRNGTDPVFTYFYYINPGVLAEFTPVTAADRQKIVTVSISLVVNAEPELAKGDVALATDVQIRQRYVGGVTNE